MNKEDNSGYFGFWITQSRHPPTHTPPLVFDHQINLSYLEDLYVVCILSGPPLLAFNVSNVWYKRHQVVASLSHGHFSSCQERSYFLVSKEPYLEIWFLVKHLVSSRHSAILDTYLFLIKFSLSLYCQTAVAQRSLGPWNFFLDMGSSCHWGLISAPGQEANGDKLGMSF